MEHRISKLHMNYLRGELTATIHRAQKQGIIHERDLLALLSGTELPQNRWQELLCHLESKGIRLIGRGEGGSLLYPEMEELMNWYSGNEPVLAYLRELERCGIRRCLSLEEEAQLCRDPGPEAVQALTEGNLLRAASIAREYTGLGMDTLDLLSEGNRGLKEAAESCDPAYGMPFVLYGACCIRRALVAGLDGCILEGGRLPAGWRRPPQEVLPDLQQLQQLLLENREHLSFREAEVMTMRLGQPGQEPCCEEDVAAAFGITENRVRQIQRKVLRRLLHSGIREKRLRAFYDREEP